MINFNEEDFISLKLENLIPIDNDILLNHYYRLREIFVSRNIDYGKEFLINQNANLLIKMNDKGLPEEMFFNELKNGFTKNEILFLTSSLFASEGTRIR